MQRSEKSRGFTWMTTVLGTQGADISQFLENTDLLLERGDKELAHTLDISLDNGWTKKFYFEGNGNRTADNFFYQPYLAALEHSGSNMVDPDHCHECKCF